MTTTTPAWLNLDAFEIPEAAVDDLRRTIAELRALVPELERLTTRARAAVAAIEEADEARKARMGSLPDDVREALSELTGETELHDVLNVIGWYAGNITESVITEEWVREALEALRAGEAEALVVVTLDRLARSLTVQEAALGHAWKAGGRVFTLDAGEVQQDDPDDPMRTALRQMMGVFAQLERGMVTARLRRGKAAKRAQGGYVGGQVSYGKRPAGDGALVVDEAEARLVEQVCRDRAAGRSYRDICAALEHAGFRTRSGGPWQPAVVRRIALRNGCT